MTAVYVKGAGVIAPGLIDWSAALPILRGQAAWAAVDIVLPPPQMLGPAERRRSSISNRLALEAARQATSHEGCDPAAIATLFGTSNGDGDVIHALLEAMHSGDGRVSPTQFHNSVHNAAAGYWSIGMGSHAASVSLGAFDSTFASTLLAGLVQAPEQDLLVCVYDAPFPAPLAQVRPTEHPVALALLLSATPGGLARLEAELVDEDVAVTPLANASLRSLHEGNAAGRGLTLLEAIARCTETEVVLDYLPGLRLRLAVAPC